MAPMPAENDLPKTFNFVQLNPVANLINVIIVMICDHAGALNEIFYLITKTLLFPDC